jgi:hypothetical protein
VVLAVAVVTIHILVAKVAQQDLFVVHSLLSVETYSRLVLVAVVLQVVLVALLLVGDLVNH